MTVPNAEPLTIDAGPVRVDSTKQFDEVGRLVGKEWSGARVWRLILLPVTALYCAVVASIVFAPCTWTIMRWAAYAWRSYWIPATPRGGCLFITYSSIEQLNVIMFIPAVFFSPWLPGSGARKRRNLGLFPEVTVGDNC